MSAALIVVAALILDADNRILIAERPAGRKYAGQWELPGGKIEPGETEPQALARELNEELGLTVNPLQLQRSPVTIDFGEGGVVVHLYECRHWQGVPEGREKQRFTWCHSANLPEHDIMSGIVGVLPELQQHYPARAA